jgi:hypothetical protein
LKLENITVNFNLASEVAPLLNSISKCIKKGKEDIGHAEDEKIVATTKEKKSEIQKVYFLKFSIVHILTTI